MIAVLGLLIPNENDSYNKQIARPRVQSAVVASCYS